MTAKELRKQLEASKANLKAYREARIGAAGSSPVVSDDSQKQEKSISAKWGCKSFSGKADGNNLLERGLLHVNTASRQFKYMSAQDRETVVAFKEANDITIMCAQIFNKRPEETKAYDELVRPILKAFGVVGGEAGAEWVPTMVSETYVEEYNLERKVASLFAEIKMPSNPYTYPVLSNGFIARKLGENAKLSGADTFTTSNTITLSAIKMANQAELPEELTEDSAVDVMKVIREQLIVGQEKAMEIAILEGDLTGTHMHHVTGIPGASGVPATDSPERFFAGLRKRALASSATTDAGGNPINESKLASARQSMGKFGVNPKDLALICGPKGYNEMLQLDDVRTLEQFGPQAPVLTGQLADYEGIPVIVSEWLREDCDATGVNSTDPSTFASILLVNRKRFFTGLRRAIQVRIENYRTQYDVWDMVAYSRKAFQGVLAASGSNYASEKSVALIINIG